jgi:hypothetical protein
LYSAEFTYLIQSIIVSKQSGHIAGTIIPQRQLHRMRWLWCRGRRSSTGSTPRWPCTRISSGSSSRCGGPSALGQGSGASGTTRRSCSFGRLSRSACRRATARDQLDSGHPGRARAPRSRCRRQVFWAHLCTLRPGRLRRGCSTVQRRALHTFVVARQGCFVAS